MDLFLQGNDNLRDKGFIEKEDFKAIFENAIIKARND